MRRCWWLPGWVSARAGCETNHEDTAVDGPPPTPTNCPSLHHCHQPVVSLGNPSPIFMPLKPLSIVYLCSIAILYQLSTSLLTEPLAPISGVLASPAPLHPQNSPTNALPCHLPTVPHSSSRSTGGWLGAVASIHIAAAW